MPIGVQPFALHRLEESTVRSIDRAGAVGFEGIELGAGEDTDGVHAALADAGLAVSSLAVDRETPEADRLDEARETADAFDTDRGVSMWLGEDRWDSREAIEDTAARLDEYADRRAERGLRLHHCDHAHEFADLGGTADYERAVEATDAVGVELDLGWATTGGADPVAPLGRIADRVSPVHRKDVRVGSGRSPPPGRATSTRARRSMPPRPPASSGRCTRTTTPSTRSPRSATSRRS